MYTARRFRDIAKFLRLLIWAELLSISIINVCSFILPLASGPLKLQLGDMYNIRACLAFLIPVAGCFSARAVLRLDALSVALTGRDDFLRIIGTGVVTEVIFRWIDALLFALGGLGTATGNPMGFYLLRCCVYGGVIICLFVMLARIAHTLHEEALGRRGVFVSVWLALGIPSVEVGAGFITDRLPLMAMPALFATLLINIVSAIIVFRILFALYTRFDRAATSCCIGCGYSLIGLPEERCPECGREFDRSEIEIVGAGISSLPEERAGDGRGMG